MKARQELGYALSIAGTALGLEIASGRAIAMFYAQMAGAGWLGVVFSALLFGTAVSALGFYAQRGRGEKAGLLISVLYALFLLAAGGMLLAEAWHIGRLSLPLRRAGLVAVLFALLPASASALSGEQGRRLPGSIFAVLLGLCLAALLAFGRMPEEPRHYAAQLRLGDSIPAALLLAPVHACTGIGLSAGMVLRQGAVGRPARLGMLSALIYGGLIVLGNGIFSRQEPLLLRLRYPFAALAAGWGKAGFYLICLLIFSGCVAGLSAILCAVIPKRKSRNFGENRC